MIVLDTNVLSEMMRPAPSDAVRRWLSGWPAVSLYTTTITQGEILYGLALLPGGRRRKRVGEAVSRMFDEDFGERILPFDSAAAEAFAMISAERRRAGRPISVQDAQIAAIARSRDAAVATRNVADFEDCGITIHDPWKRKRRPSSVT